MTPPPSLLTVTLRCRCPRCGQGPLYAGFLTVTPRCSVCELDLAAADSGDGPAVFLIFLLGLLITPAAIISGVITDWPLWLHALIWGNVTILATLLTIRPLKALALALQYRYRRQDSHKL